MGAAMKPHPLIPLLLPPFGLLVPAFRLRLLGVAPCPVLIKLLAQHVDLLLEFSEPSATGKVRLFRFLLEILQLLEELRILVGKKCEIRGRD